MNRQQRRQNAKKNSVDYRKVRQEANDDMAKSSAECLMTCFVLANRELYGHGPERSMRTLAKVDELMGPIARGEVSIRDYMKRVKEELGITIQA